MGWSATNPLSTIRFDVPTHVYTGGLSYDVQNHIDLCPWKPLKPKFEYNWCLFTISVPQPLQAKWPSELQLLASGTKNPGSPTLRALLQATRSTDSRSSGWAVDSVPEQCVDSSRLAAPSRDKQLRQYPDPQSNHGILPIGRVRQFSAKHWRDQARWAGWSERIALFIPASYYQTLP